MQSFFEWFVRSSADPARVSTFVKGFFIAMAPVAMIVLGVTDQEFSAIAEGIERVVFLGLSLLSAAMMLYGLIRKLVLGRWAAKLPWE